MTKANYDSVMVIKNALKKLLDYSDAPFGQIRTTMLTAYEHLNAMERWWEDHGKKWLEE